MSEILGCGAGLASVRVGCVAAVGVAQDDLLQLIFERFVGRGTLGCEYICRIWQEPPGALE